LGRQNVGALKRIEMAMQAVKAKNEESQSGITAGASRLGGKVSETYDDTREFLHDVRLEMKQVTWPNREEVISTTTVVVATVGFFGLFLAVVDWLVQQGVSYIFKVFGV
jgi:preprotein translocase subunit SecE